MRSFQYFCEYRENENIYSQVKGLKYHTKSQMSHKKSKSQIMSAGYNYKGKSQLQGVT